MGGAGFHEITRVGKTVLASVMGTQVWYLSTGSVDKGFKMVSVSTTVWEKIDSPALVLKLNNLALSSMSHFPFEQLWSSE